MYIHLQKFNVAIYIQIRITMCLVSKITIIKYTCNENNFPKESTDSIHLHIYNFNVNKVEKNHTLQQTCCCKLKLVIIVVVFLSIRIHFDQGFIISFEVVQSLRRIFRIFFLMLIFISVKKCIPFASNVSI